MGESKIYFESGKCLGCHSCEFACAVAHSASKDLHKAHLEDELPVRRRDVELVEGACLTVACRHCDPAPCVDACITGAMRKDPDTGLVSCDLDQCVGCWMCVMVCPFDAVQPGKVHALKCDMCDQREGGPACVEACPTGSLFEATPQQFAETVAARKRTLNAEAKK